MNKERKDFLIVVLSLIILLLFFVLISIFLDIKLLFLSYLAIFFVSLSAMMILYLRVQHNIDKKFLNLSHQSKIQSDNVNTNLNRVLSTSNDNNKSILELFEGVIDSLEGVKSEILDKQMHSLETIKSQLDSLEGVKSEILEKQMNSLETIKSWLNNLNLQNSQKAENIEKLKEYIDSNIKTNLRRETELFLEYSMNLQEGRKKEIKELKNVLEDIRSNIGKIKSKK